MSRFTNTWIRWDHGAHAQAPNICMINLVIRARVSLDQRSLDMTLQHSTCNLLLRRRMEVHGFDAWRKDSRSHSSGLQSNSTHMASIYTNSLEQNNCLHKKRFQLEQDLFERSTWPLFHRFRTAIIYGFPAVMWIVKRVFYHLCDI